MVLIPCKRYFSESGVEECAGVFTEELPHMFVKVAVVVVSVGSEVEG